MKKILLASILFMCSVAFAQQNPQQCFISTSRSGGTTNQFVNVPNLNTTPAATTGIAGWGYVIGEPCFTTGVAWQPLTADTSSGTATDKYVIGIYCFSGNCVPGQLYATTGEMSAATFAPSGSLNVVNTISWTATNPVQLPAGMYIVTLGVSGCTASNLCAVISAETVAGSIYPFFQQNMATYSSGLPTTLSTLPTISPVTNATAKAMPELFFY